MSHEVAYADLKFVKASLETNPKAQEQGAADGELTYENVHLAKPSRERISDSTEQHKGAQKRFWPMGLGLLAASLLLLSMCIGFGVRYLQVSQRLQETSEAYAADNGSLARRIGDQEQSLGQAQSQLRQAEKNLLRLETALGESRKLAKETREQLYQKTVELNATRDELATVQNQRKEAEKKLNASVAKACSDWCPKKWVLHRGKCLFFSTVKSNWEESKTACYAQSSHLLITKTFPEAVPYDLKSNRYWIGLYCQWEQNTYHWTWLDGSRFEGSSSWGCHYECGILQNEALSKAYCDYNKHYYICEKAPRPGAFFP